MFGLTLSPALTLTSVVPARQFGTFGTGLHMRYTFVDLGRRGIMEQLVDRIRNGLTAGRYPNERAVSTSIVIPILRTLGWDDSDPSQVMPEYANPRGRVDYALSFRANSPAFFVEVKRVEQSADADKQLFEYAFHEGAQIAVLTDGQLWNFYLPGQHGSYDERRVYQLDRQLYTLVSGLHGSRG